MGESLPLVKGTLDLLVLKALSWGPMHGFEVVRWLETQSANTLDMDDSAVYQALYRMEQREWIEAEWGVTENSRRARYYRLASSGRAHLRSQTVQWVQYAKTVSGILTASRRTTLAGARAR